MGVRIVTDSSCDLPQAVVDEHRIEIVPLTIRFGTDEYVDRVELGTQEFWAKVASTDTLPETAAPAAGAFEETFRRVLDEGADGIVCINLSSRLSATMQSAQLAAKAVDDGAGRIAVVDSKSVSMGLGLQCINAAVEAERGASVAGLVPFVEDQAERTRLFATLDTLEHLRKGGRIGAAQALLGGVLSIKPVIQVRDGVVAEAGKVRTRSKSLRALADRVAEAGYPKPLFLLHADAPDYEEIIEMVAPNIARDDIMVGDIGPVIGTHAGPRTIGVGWLEPPAS